MAAAEWEFVSPAVGMVITNFTIAIHFRINILFVQ
jgi:hypothetical protein